MADPVRVLLVEDHRVLAEGLELSLERHADLAIVGIAGSVAQALPLVAEQQPDVVLIDYYLPDGTGAEVARAVRHLAPQASCVVLTAEAGDDVLAEMVEAGASGFLLKSQSTAEIADALRRATAGEMLIPATALASLIARQRSRSQESSERDRVRREMTSREREVLHLMGEGLDNRSIAERLVVSLPTARGHVQRVIQKLQAHSKLEAVARASRLGLLQTDGR